MNVFGKRERSWRKAHKRGVSPIIATILLVAITVVLAAVLYVLISGLTRGPGSAPLGTNFGWGTATPEHPAAASNGCAAGHYCYVITIASSTGVTASDLGFSLRNNAGGSVSAIDVVTVWSLTGNVASATWVTDGNGPSAGGTVTLSSTYTVVLDAGTSSISGNGDSLEAVGIAGYSGSVSVVLP